MRIVSRLLLVFLATLSTGCGAPQAGALPAAAHGHGISWMAAGLNKRDLLYVSNQDGTVSVFRYWQRTLVGVLTKFVEPLGECADASGDVYITDYSKGSVDEYAHGATKPLKTLNDSPYTPDGCGASPNNGNLAVVNNPANRYSKGNVAVYPHGSGQPVIYQTAHNDHFTACAYDNRGDLLATSRQEYFETYTEFYYLPKDGTQLVAEKFSAPGQNSQWSLVQGVAWDGKYWVVLSYDRLYRFIINVTAKYVDTITLSGGYGTLAAAALYQKSPKLEATQIVGGFANSGKSAVDYWSYPAGGTPIGTITNDLDSPGGIAVSLGVRK